MSKRLKKAGVRATEISTAIPTTAGLSISIEQMLDIEGGIVDEALIIAEDSVVRKLVSQAFPAVTLSNLRRGVNYRFLITARAEQNMRAFLLKAHDKLNDPRAEERLEFHCLDDDVFRLLMPGCIFDSCHCDRHAAYCRLPMEGGYTWFQLSESHRDEYTAGFADIWENYVSCNRVQILAAEWRYLARILLPSLVLAVLLLIAVHKLFQHSSGIALPKFIVCEATGALAIWIAACVGIGQFDSVLANSIRFQRFKRAAMFVFVTLILGTVVNVFSSWITK